MENLSQKATVKAHHFLFVFLFVSQGIYAQIPQNIQVEGEVDDGWSLVFYLLTLVIIILGIFLVGKFLMRKK